MERYQCSASEGVVGLYEGAGLDKGKFDEEVRSWMADGILIEWDPQKHGAVENFIPLMAVRQDKKHKVMPVFDYRELTAYVERRPGEKRSV